MIKQDIAFLLEHAFFDPMLCVDLLLKIVFAASL